ncbi:MAG: metallo-mystery pair system four-Cys motif protein [Woeseiaceae bacterium]|nr:metallo-mystery pair system four-Cys motif protein [Woeseiaceae bacterium]
MTRRSGVQLLLLLGLTACAPPQQALQIRFEARADAGRIACDTASSGLTLSDLRFYVSDITLRRPDGTSVPVVLLEDDRWQQRDLGMVDLEDGSGNCLNGTADTNDRLVGSAPAGDYTQLSFVIGVPFDRNHADPLAAAAPLDDSAMHWHWRSGYKFLRAGVGSVDDGFWLHLGSAGCEGTVGAISGCKFPNRMSVTLADYTPGDTVVVDVGALARAADLGDAAVSDCVSGPADDDCGAAFAILGLDHGSGTMSGMQQLFRLSRP